MAQSLRDKLRAKTIEKQRGLTWRSREVEYDGEKFVIKQPSHAQRGAILTAAKVQHGDVEKIDVGELSLWAVICCTHTPDGEKVFDASDADALRELPAGGFVDEFAPVALELMNVDAEADAKNSQTTKTPSSSST